MVTTISVCPSGLARATAINSATVRAGTLSLTTAQVLGGSAALGKITNPYQIAATGVTLADLADLVGAVVHRGNRSRIHVLATLDESTYSPKGMFGQELAMGKDHPIAWSHCVGKGRAFYAAPGHLPAVYAVPAAIASHAALTRLTGVVDKLLIYPERMQKNLDKMGGLVHSQRVLLALTQAGVSREDSYRLVQRNAMKVWESDGQLSLMELLKADSEVTAALSVQEIEDKFDLGYHLKHVDTIFSRVFG